MVSSTLPNAKRRAIIMVIDGCGIGAAPDHAKFGDSSDCNSIANTAKSVGGLRLPNLQRIGLGNITNIEGVSTVNSPSGMFGRLMERSNGKDTQTGHWEMMGIITETPFQTYPEGFPKRILDQFIKETGCKDVLCNAPASGTAVIEAFGPEHQKTGYPIVYTSADSVFQIACHVETVPLKTLYRWCEIAREIMRGPNLIGRIIARPFTGEPGSYRRLSFERRDYGVTPPQETFLDNVLDTGAGVLGIGKIEDIFNRQGLSHALHTGTNKEGLDLTLEAVRGKFDYSKHSIIADAPDSANVIFTNLVDTDMLWGHRRNVEGYGKALEEIDEGVGNIIDAMTDDDVLLISSDHGNDPTAPGTDHTREYVPILAYSKALQGSSAVNHDIGIRDGFFDTAASLSAWLGLDWKGPGVSFLPKTAKVTK